jgi:hypothetical protein
MQRISRMIVMAFGLTAASAVAQPPHRRVVVVGNQSDPRVAKQHAALELDTASLRERDVIVQDITPEAARRLRPNLGVDALATFEVLLVGKDGGVKLRRSEPVAAAEITALIDTMPMRRNEMKR